jgi:hypothetical protein
LPLAGLLEEIEKMGSASDFNGGRKALAKSSDEMILLIKAPAAQAEENEVCGKGCFDNPNEALFPSNPAHIHASPYLPFSNHR